MHRVNWQEDQLVNKRSDWRLNDKRQFEFDKRAKQSMTLLVKDQMLKDELTKDEVVED